MLDPIKKVFFEFLQQRRTTPEDTALLAQLRHNKDLCPMLQRRCEQVLVSLERHQTIVYDVQGPSDAGVDVVVRLSDGDDARYIAFQIKSDVEAVKGVYEKLKAQWVDAQSFYGPRLVDYYILLAWNERARRDQIRTVEQAFVGIPQVKIIEPGYAAYFLIKVTRVQIAALASTFLSDDDPLLIEARSTTSSWTSRQAALYIEVLARHLEHEEPPTLSDLTRSTFVGQEYESSQKLWFYKGTVLPAGLKAPHIEELPDRGDPYEHIEDDLDALEGDVSERDGRFFLDDCSDAVLALGFELKARHRFVGIDLRTGLLALLSDVENLQADDVVDTLIESFWRHGLSKDEQTELVAAVLQLNFPHSESLAEAYEVAEFDSLDITSWRRLAAEMLAIYS